MTIFNFLTRAFLAAVVCGVGFGLLAGLFDVRVFSSFDSSVISFVQGWENPELTKVMKVLTWIGKGTQVTVISLAVMIFLYLVLGHRSELILFACVVIGTPLLNLVLRRSFSGPGRTLTGLSRRTGSASPADIPWLHSACMELSLSFYGSISGRDRDEPCC